LPSFRIADADFMLTVGTDLFETFVSPVSHAAQFARAKKNSHFEWTHVEPHASLTGFQAEHRYSVTPGSEPYLLTFLLRKVSRINVAGDRHIADLIEALPKLTDRGFAEKTGLTVEQLNGIAGANCAACDTGLTKVSKRSVPTVSMKSASAIRNDGNSARLGESGIGVLFVSNVDAVAGSRATLGLENIDKAGLSVGLTEFMNDTMALCDVILPLSDTLESWGDVTPKRGLVNVVQPAVEPLHNTRTTGDILLQLVGSLTGNAPAASYQEFLFAKRLPMQWHGRFSW
jgi:molybdopterin-containing oxidoreductase family iron-sulfur binding subunit